MAKMMVCQNLKCDGYASVCSTYCVKCGRKMKESAPRPANNKKCLICKAGGVFPQDNFCGSCGNSLRPSEPY